MSCGSAGGFVHVRCVRFVYEALLCCTPAQSGFMLSRVICRVCRSEEKRNKILFYCYVDYKTAVVIVIIATEFADNDDNADDVKLRSFAKSTAVYKPI